MDKKNQINENKPLKSSLLVGFVFSAWYFLSAILAFRQEYAVVFVGFFILTIITMRVTDVPLTNKTIAIAFVGAIIFVMFATFCTVFSVPDRDIYNLSTVVTNIATIYGQK